MRRYKSSRCGIIMITPPTPPPTTFNSTCASLQRYFSLTFSLHNLREILKRTHSDFLCALLECGNCTQHNVQGLLALGLQQDAHLEFVNTKAHTSTSGLWSRCCSFELSWCDRHIWMWWLGADHRNISTINKLECLSSIQTYMANANWPQVFKASFRP